MNRLQDPPAARLPAQVAVIGLVALIATVLTGCSAGQISQTATQEPAVNGNRVTFNNVALRDIRIQAAQTGDFLQPGRTVELVLVAVNQSPDVADRLVGISTDIGTVTLNGDARLPAGGMLFIGTPEGQKVAPGPLGSSNAAKAIVSLTKPITNGLTYNFTFNFEKAGQASVAVPISAGLASTAAPDRLSSCIRRALSHQPDTVSGVANARSQYRCSECRHLTAKWVGRCLECGTWGTVDEVAVLSAVGGSGRRSAGLASGPASRAVPISSVEPNVSRHCPTGIEELDRVLGWRRGARFGDAAGGRSRRG